MVIHPRDLCTGFYTSIPNSDDFDSDVDEVFALGDVAENEEVLLRHHLATFAVETAEEWLAALTQEGGVVAQVAEAHAAAQNWQQFNAVRFQAERGA